MKKWLIICVLVGQSYGTTWFVRAGGSGSGTSWAAAWTNVSNIAWSSLAAGDTVCVAGGSYGGITTAKGGASGNPITVKRAYAPDSVCGSTTSGWNASFDALVTVTGISINNSFVTFDGSIWHGMLVNLVGASLSSKVTGIAYTSSANATNITIRNIEISGPCPGSTGCLQGNVADPRSIELTGTFTTSYPTKTNVLIQYVDAHGACNGIWSHTNTNLIVEHSRFADQKELTPGPVNNCHENVIINQNTTGTFRYNEVVNWTVEGILSCDNGACNTTWDVYGNLWHDPDNGTGGVNRVFEPQAVPGNPGNVVFHVYNNTFVNTAQVFSLANSGAYAAGSIVQNNIFLNASAGSIPTHDYNLSNVNLSEAHGQTATAPFVNPTAHTVAGYHLTGHTTAGITLASPFNVDYDGNTRVAWDRGFVEFAAAVDCGNTQNWTTSTCQAITGTQQLSTAMVNGSNDPNAWSVVSRHGEYAQNETECNIPTALSITSGVLDIVVTKVNKTCGDFSTTTGASCPATGCPTNGNVAPSSFPFTTGDVQWNTFNFQYGTVVWRGQVPPPATRLWPAFWMLKAGTAGACQTANKYSGDLPAGSCPDAGQSGYQEIDMLDCYNYTGNPNECGFHVANPSFGMGGNCDAYPPSPDLTIPHVWAMNWTSGNIKMYWDGSVINGTGCATSIGNPEFLLMQTQTGGTAGTPVGTGVIGHQTLDYIKVCSGSGQGTGGITGQNMTAAQCTSEPATSAAVTFYDDFTLSISGNISGAGGNAATVNLTGTASASTTSDASGNYTFSGLANGSYTVTPVKTGYTFVPTSLSVTVNGANITGQNFASPVPAVAPSCTPTSGTVPQTVSCSNPNSSPTVICYTTDGTIPDTNGDGATCTVGTVYATAITISLPSVLRVIAGVSTGADSSIVVYTYTAASSASNPSCTPTSGNVPQTVTCTNPNAGTTVMCYTVNGVIPATTGTGAVCNKGLKYTVPVVVSTATTFQIVAGILGGTDSSVVSYTYTTSTAASNPSCTPTSGQAPQTVTCTNPNAGTTVICYAISPTIPATNGSGTACTTGTIYTTPIVVSFGGTLEVIAGISTGSDSSVVTYTYTNAPPAVLGATMLGISTKGVTVKMGGGLATPVLTYSAYTGNAIVTPWPTIPDMGGAVKNNAIWHDTSYPSGTASPVIRCTDSVTAPGSLANHSFSAGYGGSGDALQLFNANDTLLLINVTGGSGAIVPILANGQCDKAVTQDKNQTNPGSSSIAVNFGNGTFDWTDPTRFYSYTGTTPQIYTFTNLTTGTFTGPVQFADMGLGLPLGANAPAWQNAHAYTTGQYVTVTGSYPNWLANHSYNPGDIILPTVNNVWGCAFYMSSGSAQTTAGTPPNFSTTPQGGCVTPSTQNLTDGTARWRNLAGPGSFTYELTSAGGTSGATFTLPANPTLMTTVADNGLTWTNTGVAFTPGWNSYGGISKDSTRMCAAFSSNGYGYAGNFTGYTGGQDSGQYVVCYDKTLNKYHLLNTVTGTQHSTTCTAGTGFNCSGGTLSFTLDGTLNYIGTCGFLLHNNKGTMGSDYQLLSHQQEINGTCNTALVWRPFAAFNATTGGQFSSGTFAHAAIGGTHLQALFTQANFYGTPSTTGLVGVIYDMANPTATPPISLLTTPCQSSFTSGLPPPCDPGYWDQHMGWAYHPDATDTQPACGSVYNLKNLSPIPVAPWQGEELCVTTSPTSTSVASPPAQTMWRFAHILSTGTSTFFDAQFAISSMSGTGKKLAFTSDWGCTLGPTDGVSAVVCGAPWLPNFAYSLNTLVAPVGATAGTGAIFDVFKVTTAGTSGTSFPGFATPALAWGSCTNTPNCTVTDNNGVVYTDVTGNPGNQRADVFIIQLAP